MERYIGLDVHAASTTVAIVGPSGRRIGTRVVETNGRALIEALTAIPGSRHVALEEGTEAGWLSADTLGRAARLATQPSAGADWSDFIG